MKEQNLFNVADFLAIGTHFLSFSQTTVASRNRNILQLEHIFQPILHFGWWKQVFCLLETVLFYSEFFSACETITDTWGKSIFKEKYIFANEHLLFFYIFRDFKVFKSGSNFSV